MATNPMPYAGDVSEFMPAGGQQIGPGTLESSSETRTFDVPWESRRAFLAAMLGRATLSDDDSMVAQGFRLLGLGPGPVKDPGEGEREKVPVELEYKPWDPGDPEDPPSGGPLPVQYEESTDYAVDLMALPHTLWYVKGARNGDRVYEQVPDGFSALPVHITRKIWSVKNLAAFSDGEAFKVFGRVTAGDGRVKLSVLQAQATFFAGGTRSYNLTVGIDVRPADWNRFYIADHDPPGWGYYYTNQRQGRFSPYETGPVMTFLRDLGINLSGVNAMLAAATPQYLDD